MPGSFAYDVRLRVQGELSASWWSAVFTGLAVTEEPGGTTLVAGELCDETALFGLLTAIRDLGLSLVSIEGVGVRREGRRGLSAGSGELPMPERQS